MLVISARTWYSILVGMTVLKWDSRFRTCTHFALTIWGATCTTTRSVVLYTVTHIP